MARARRPRSQLSTEQRADGEILRHAAFFDAAPVAQVIIDQAGIIRDGNAAFAALFERDGVPVGKPFIVVVPMTSSGIFWRHVRTCVETGATTKCELDYILRSGASGTVEAISAPIRDDELGGTVLLTTLIDVSARKRVELAARNAHEVELRIRAQMEVLSNAHAAISAVVATSGHGDGLARTLEVIVEQARHVADAHGAIITVGSGELVEHVACAGLADARPVLSTLAKAGAVGRVAQGHVARLAGDVARAAGDVESATWLTSVLGVPIRHGERLLGSLFIVNKRLSAAFDDEDERFVRMLALRAALAIEAVVAAEAEAAQRSWLQAVVDKMPEGVVIADASGRVLCNEIARQMAMSPQDENLVDICAPDGKPLEDDHPMFRALRGELVSGVEVLLHDREGRDIPALASAAPITDDHGRALGAVCLWRDVSALHDLQRLREEWSAVIAHDLRQPLSVIKLSDEILARSPAAGSGNTGKAIERIRVSVTRMLTMIDELLDSALIEARQLKVVKSSVILVSCVHEMIEQLEVQLRGREVIVDAPSDPEMTRAMVDEARIMQILGNLLSNAGKYASPQSPILVRLARNDNEIVVSVTNQGKTIQPDELPHLFSRFYRTRSASRSTTRGLGLGLYIARGLVEAHGGRIQATSQDGETTFSFSVPL